MKPTSKETYKIIRAMLKMKRFTQYEISRKEKITFSLVNRVVNWFLERGYVAKREGGYAIAAPAAIFALFPLYRSLKPYTIFDVNIKREDALKLIKERGVLCLTSTLSYHRDYYRDPAIHAYLEDEGIFEELKRMPKGYCRIALYREDLNKNDFEEAGGYRVTSKIRTIIDLFCANKAYIAEGLIKGEWD